MVEKRIEIYNNLFRAIQNSDKRSLALETSKTNIFSIFKKIFVKVKLVATDFRKRSQIVFAMH